MGTDGMHLRVTRQLTKELTKPFLIIYQQSCLTRINPGKCKLTNTTSSKRTARRRIQGTIGLSCADLSAREGYGVHHL